MPHQTILISLSQIYLSTEQSSQAPCQEPARRDLPGQASGIHITEAVYQEKWWGGLPGGQIFPPHPDHSLRSLTSTGPYWAQFNQKEAGSWLGLGLRLAFALPSLSAAHWVVWGCGSTPC